MWVISLTPFFDRTHGSEWTDLLANTTGPAYVRIDEVIVSDLVECRAGEDLSAGVAVGAFILVDLILGSLNPSSSQFSLQFEGAG